MKSEILEKEEELRLAMLQGNITTLNELISDDLVFLSPFGCIVTKQMDLEAHSTKMQIMTKLEPSEQIIDVKDGFVISTVKMDVQGKYGQMDITGQYRYLRIWQKVDSKWKIVAGSVVKIIC